MRRREFIGLVGSTAASWPLAARAQQSGLIRRIGVLLWWSPSNREGQAGLAAFQKVLQQAGWTDGVNIRFDITLSKSVATGGTRWLDQFANCLKRVRLIHATDGEYGDAEVFAYASRLAMGLAILRAQQLVSEPVQLAVWDGLETPKIAGCFADMQAWQRQGLKTVTIRSNGNLPPDAFKTGQSERSHPPQPARKVRAIMFGDFHGFSGLSDRQMLDFYEHIMQRVAAVLDGFGGEIAARNTWGDGLFVVFNDLGAAARCAMQIQSTLAGLDLPSLGLPASLGLRLGTRCLSGIRNPGPNSKVTELYWHSHQPHGTA